jgi:O-antigen chain-terminating methyltransferase
MAEFPSSANRVCPVDCFPADAVSALDGDAFVTEAFHQFLHRLPDEPERARMLDELLRGESKSWILGRLRYGIEGRHVGVPVTLSFRRRYLVQRMFRWPIVGSLVERAAALWRLPMSLQYFRAMEQRLAQASRQGSQRSQPQSATASNAGSGSRDRLEDLERLMRLDQAELADLRRRLKAMEPPILGPELIVEDSPLVDRALTRCGLPLDLRVSSLPESTQYAMFEQVFYESAVVAAKQRIYLPYISRDLTAKHPFLDLGCGRGEFLRILRDESIGSLGVDINPYPLRQLLTDGFNVHEGDLLDFLERDQQIYSGAAILQVVEHLQPPVIDRMLTLVSMRLAPGAPIFVETPNPLSPFALAHFHTDPTHLNPIPPERMRYAIEGAGFERARTLFQNRVPEDQYCGTDSRAYFVDYAVIAYRRTW